MRKFFIQSFSGLVQRPGKALGLAFVLASAAHLFLYVYRTTANVLFQDNIPLTLTLVSRFLKGTLRLPDLWAPYNGIHRVVLSLLITLANVSWFHWNVRIELFLGVVWNALTACGVLLLIRRLAPEIRPRNFAFILLLLLPIVSSLNGWENYVFNGGTYHVLQAASYVFASLAFSYLLVAGSAKAQWLYLAATIWCILIATSIYSIAFGCATIAVVVLAFIALPDRRKALCFALSVNLLSIAIYLYGLKPPQDMTPGDAGPWLNTVRIRVFFGPFIAVLFHNEAIAAHFGPILQLSIGIVVFSVFLGCVLYSFKRLRDNCWFASICILIIHSVLVSLMIAVGRVSFGPSAGLASRYVTQTLVGVVACAVVSSLIAISSASSRRLRAFSILLVVFLTVANICSVVSEWRISPFRLKTYQKMAAITLDPYSFKQSDFVIFQSDEPFSSILDAIAIWKQHRLGPCAHMPNQPSPLIPSFLTGFYDPEGQDAWRWIARNASFKVSGGAKHLRIQCFRPDGPFANSVTVTVNGARVCALEIPPGTFYLDVSLPNENVFVIRIDCDRAKPPDTADRRELALIVSRVVVD